MTPRAVLLLALASASCGAPLMKLPGGPGTPAPDQAAAALAEATSACRPLSSLTAEIGVSGSVNGRRTRGRLLAGLASPASVRLEAVAPFGAPVFIFVARDGDATLLLPRDRRVLEHGQPDAVLEAVTGVSVTPAGLRQTLSGCADEEPTADARDLGNGWLLIPGSTRLYLRRVRPADPWRIVVSIRQDSSGAAWRAEYSDFVDRLPRTVRLASEEEGRFNLKLALSQVETNVPLDDAAFRVDVPASATPITLGELRDAGPLADEPRSNAR